MIFVIFFLSEKSFGTFLNYSLYERSWEKERFSNLISNLPNHSNPSVLLTLACQLLCFVSPESHSFMIFEPPVSMVSRREATVRGQIRCECLCELLCHWKLMQLHVEQADDPNQREATCWSRKPLEWEVGNGF